LSSRKVRGRGFFGCTSADRLVSLGGPAIQAHVWIRGFASPACAGFALFETVNFLFPNSRFQQSEHRPPRLACADAYAWALVSKLDAEKTGGDYGVRKTRRAAPPYLMEARPCDGRRQAWPDPCSGLRPQDQNAKMP